MLYYKLKKITRKSIDDVIQFWFGRSTSSGTYDRERNILLKGGYGFLRGATFLPILPRGSIMGTTHTAASVVPGITHY